MFEHALELHAPSLAATHRIAAALAELARTGDVIVLAGEMGAGKTAFAQGFGRALGVDEPITSPTFTLVHSYEVPPTPERSRATLHHADLYRLDRTAEVSDLALVELAEDRGIVLVEWGDVVDAMFGDHLAVHLDPDTEHLAPSEDETEDVDGSDDSPIDDDFGLDDDRVITLSAVGGSWAGRWNRLVSSVEEFRC